MSAPAGRLPHDLRAQVRAEVAAHRPGSPREQWSWRRTLRLLDWLGDPFDEHADPTHVTGSAIVVDPDARVLLHRHKRLRRWMQPGGHLDPSEHPAQAARRETAEETGVDAEHPGSAPTLVHVDVHEGPRGHVHLDLRYLLLAGRGEVPQPGPGESPDVAWFPGPRAGTVGDASTSAAVHAALTTAPRGPR